MRTPRLSLVFPAALLCLSILACVFNTQTSSPTQNPQGGAGSGSYRGSGSQDLANPAAGLDGLSAYQAVLTISFNGTQGGKSFAWNETRTLAVDNTTHTRLLSIATRGLPEESSLDGWVLGTYNGLFVQRRGQAAPCGMLQVQDIQLPTGFEPASQLPPVFGATEAGGAEVVEGVSVKNYTFDGAAVGLQGGEKVEGRLALAEQGGYLVSYQLSVDGSPDFYGEGVEGKMTWEYTLSNVNGTIAPDLPVDCPPGMVDVAPMPGAVDLDERPGLQEYTLTAGLSDVVDYFTRALPAAGYQAAGEPFMTDQFAYLEYTRQGQILSMMARVSGENILDVSVVLENSAAQNIIIIVEPTPNATEAASLAIGDLEKRVGLSLSLLLGNSQEPSKLSSYHLEVNETTPTNKNGSLQVEASQLTADVSGSDVHLKIVENNKTKEAYMIGEDEYLVTNGKASPAPGAASITWAMWSLDIITPLTTASLGITPQGIEMVAGRPAEKYDLDTTKAPPGTLEALNSMSLTGVTIVSAKGTIWVDQATGAMLKLVLDYESQMKSSSGGAAQTVNGHIDLAVSQVGEVQVKLP